VRFFFVHTLKRHYPPGEFRYPKTPKKLPIILSKEEVTRMIDAATTLLHRTLLMTLYSTGMRRAELASLKVGDIDSARRRRSHRTCFLPSWLPVEVPRGRTLGASRRASGDWDDGAG